MTSSTAAPRLRFVIDLDADTVRTLGGNRRGHTKATSAAVASLRDTVTWRLRGNNAYPVPRPSAGPVVIDVVAHRPDRRRADPDNVAAVAKPVIDGIVAAGHLPDDSHQHVTEVRYRIHPGCPHTRPRTVRFTVDLHNAPPAVDDWTCDG